MKNRCNYTGAESVQPLLLLRESQKKMMQVEMSCMAQVIKELYYQDDLKMSDETRQRRMGELIHKLLGGPDGPGDLQKKMDRTMDGILQRLQEDFPQLGWQEILMFSYAAAGFSSELSYHLAGLSCSNAASVARSRLKRTIQYSHSPHKQEYLSLLPAKGCRIGEEVLSLHNLK